MADITVGTSVQSLLHRKSVRAGPVWINTNAAYIFYVDGSADLVYQKTSDGGATWAAAVSVKAATLIKTSIWYDRWTPGNAGRLIHIAYSEADGDDILYRNLNTLDDSLSTEVTVFAGASFTNGNWDTGVVDIVRARGGNLYLAFWGDADGEFGFYRSTDNGDTWTSRAQLADGNAVDLILLMPGNEDDADDIWCVYWDVSVNIITVKVYDDSENDWPIETLISAGMDNSISFYQMSAALRHSDNHVIIAAWSEVDAATADLKVWDAVLSLTPADVAVTALANVATDLDASAQVAVLINQQNNDIYVAYLKGGELQATVDVVYKKSTDGGTTWGSEQAYSEAAADDIRALWAGISIGPDGGRFQPTFFNIDLTDLFINLVNTIYISPSVLPLRDAYVGASVDDIPNQGSARS
ncbi:hypothetical protein LCGC14_1163010 [marine sediment metagenome]|uniref:Sialidase domain-containing protein n=1 Tax=marine sediment metagenome TaxID=412755 RepID=A0A0F9MF49_9ZZZZ